MKVAKLLAVIALLTACAPAPAGIPIAGFQEEYPEIDPGRLHEILERHQVDGICILRKGGWFQHQALGDDLGTPISLEFLRERTAAGDSMEELRALIHVAPLRRPLILIEGGVTAQDLRTTFRFLEAGAPERTMMYLWDDAEGAAVWPHARTSHAPHRFPFRGDLIHLDSGTDPSGERWLQWGHPEAVHEQAIPGLEGDPYRWSADMSLATAIAAIAAQFEKDHGIKVTTRGELGAASVVRIFAALHGEGFHHVTWDFPLLPDIE